jgi:hypothetical protein
LGGESGGADGRLSGGFALDEAGENDQDKALIHRI